MYENIKSIAIKLEKEEIGSAAYTNALEEIKKRLAQEVKRLLETDFQKLLNILYRIDISEEKLKTLTANTDSKNWPEIIIEAIIERELQKAETRRKYRSNN